MNNFIEITRQPNGCIKFLRNCFNKSTTNSIFHELDFEVQVKNIHFCLEFEFYALISVINFDQNLPDSLTPNVLFCENNTIRFLSKTMMPHENIGYLVPFDMETYKCKIENFVILKPSKKDLYEYIDNNYFQINKKYNSQLLKKTFNDADFKKFEETILGEIDKCRIKVELKIFNSKLKRFMESFAEPVYTDIIRDAYPNLSAKCNQSIHGPLDTSITNREAPRILRISSNQGSFFGGDEIFLFTTLIDPDDLKVEFFQMDQKGDLAWRSFATFSQCDCHVNFALAIKTPKYDLFQKLEKNFEKKIKVYFRLLQPSTQYSSEQWAFYYYNDQRNNLKSLLFHSIVEEKINWSKRKIKEICDVDQEIHEFKKIKAQDVQMKSSYAPIKDKLEFKFKIESSLIDAHVKKMNDFTERMGNSLLNFSKSRSFHHLIKSQRHLFKCSDQNGNTPIHLSIMHRHFDLLEIFVDVISTIPEENSINIRNKAGLSPLLMACHMQEIELCDFLLEAHADLTISDYDGNNPLHIACLNNNTRLLKVLVKFIDRNRSYDLLNQKNHEGYAPIHLCVFNRSYEMTRELIYFPQLKINISDSRKGYTALHHASSLPDTFGLVFILVMNLEIDLNLKSYCGFTPLHLAVINKNYLTLTFLLHKGADMNIQDDFPIHLDHELVWRIGDKKLANLKKLDFFSSAENRTIVETLREVTKFSIDLEELCSEDIDGKIKFKNSVHNHDPLDYIRNDEWVKELFFLFKFRF
ncbi:nuclear factor NF-kappa-B p100 subunit-like protein [Brachionus plicatilis]|uniref:Nuclear factor NF-kappa-B p100 subunit-like protein n=1 Tax=Brachionus plicatilis TaxID=10195 RepID=A0A3M7RKX6_BRAPC|nr:nuclear factor NF-kappa-B p100 subunit-like protein [Brachionus plicatilis]